MNALVSFVALVTAGLGAGVYALVMRDLVRRGRLQRKHELMISRGEAPALPEGRVPCPECAEAILPQARRCPFCRTVVIGRI